MSKEEFLKIRTCVLKVHIHCDGCKQKVKKLLQKIDGVYTTTVDAEQGKVTVSGNIEPAALIKKLAKSGKHAEIWGAPKPSNNNQNNLNNQFKNMQIDNGKAGKDNKNQNQQGGKEQPKGGQQQIPQQLQQLKGFENMKLPQFKDLKGMMPFKDQKTVKFDMPEDDEFTDDEFDDDDYDDDDYDDDEFDEEDIIQPLNKPKPAVGNGAANAMMNMMNVMKGGGNGGGGGNGKKGGGVEVPVQVKGMAVNSDGKNGNGGNKGGGGGNQNQGVQVKMMRVQVMNNMMHHGFSGMDVTHHGLGGNVGQMGGNILMTHMGNFPIGQMGNIPAVQGLPAAAMNHGGGSYYQGPPPEYLAAGNQYHQQQYMAAMMNQQRQNGMMYARSPPPPVAYMPPPEPYGHYFSDENTGSGCNVM
ncbi:hypothetical protein AQUCO_01700409v1 [Aquilegia coerulea]|uniref:HMA domain-containing protein n=2 Tax=Aquilegia coerulea TaxID=218851 RepID=A0A2G5DMR1_AQUCA|nr:hypothetical protein AQUCO_01700409v1 [Aquilegia coerulea]PIA44794.1 hypothetical protein AQUCO_01700409v1 [Aquilegia coerulea]